MRLHPLTRKAHTSKDLKMKIRTHLIGALTFAALSLSVLSAPVLAKETEQTIVIKDHLFIPAVIEIPVDKRIKLVIDNQDATPEEFESHDLKIEKIIPGKTKGFVRVGPLPAGEYTFVGEFHEATAKGKIIVK